MTPTVERLVRLMVLLPEHRQVWDSLIADCGDDTEVMAVRWFVGDAAKMWPPVAPVNLARAVLATFAEAGEETMRMMSAVLLADSGRLSDASAGSRAGAAWVAQASATAI